MKKTQKLGNFIRARGTFLSIIGVVLVFAGFAAYQMVSAQSTTSFTDPTCDPTTNPGSCNTPQPLFLTPKTGQTGAQVVETPVQIGKSGASKDLTLFGGVVLSDSAKNISTIAGYTGQAIHATSTLGHAIYGSSGGNGTGGLYGIATSATAYGVAGSSGGFGTYAIFADASTGGTAGKFIGPVVYQSGANTATLSIDGTGNLNIVTSASGKGLMVNGFPPAGAQKAVTIVGNTTGTGSSTLYNLTTPMGGNYVVTQISVLYQDTTAPEYWKQLPSTAINFKECSGNSPLGNLELTNPIPVANLKYRINYAYDPGQAAFVCFGQDTTPPDSVSISGVTSGYWYGSVSVTLSATATESNGGVIEKVDFYYDSTLIGTDTTSPYSISWNPGAATPDTYVTGTAHTVSAVAKSLNVTPTTTSNIITNVKTYATGTRQTCGNTLTCTTSAYCCLSAATNDGQPTTPINKCTDITVTPPSCQSASNYCGACSGTAPDPPQP